MTVDAIGDFAHLLGAALVGGPLLYASIGKLLDPEPLRLALPRYDVPIPSTRAAVFGVAVIELLLGASVIVLTHWAAALVASCTYLLFAGLLVRSLLAGRAGDCGCFGALPSALDANAVTRALLLAAAGLLLAALRAITVVGPYFAGSALVVVGAILVGAVALDTLIVMRRVSRR